MSVWDSIFGASALPNNPTGQTVQSASLQPWAQPYINNYLNKSQQLVTNAQPTAFQNQVWSAAQNLDTPGQFAAGSSLAQRGGEGQLSTAPTALAYGQKGADIGSQGIGIGALGQMYGFGAGQNYAAQATNPYAVGAYMNPYIQQSLAPQLSLLNQQQQLAAQDINAKAAGQGAFGGNRATLAQGLNAQNYDLARQQAIGQGYNQAFQQAQQAQQFGANLGLQGAQQGVQAGLAGLGTALQGQQVGLQGVQGAQQGYSGATQAGAALGNIGAQQGQYELQKLALQNQLANQQYNLPFQNQQFMQGMMAGLPISTQTSQTYQAPPNTLSQLAGVGTTALGGYLAYKALTGATGGLPKDFKKVPTYADGGDVQDVYLGGNKQAGIGDFEMDQINAINRGQAPAGIAGLMQLRPTEQENYTGFSNSGGGPLDQIRLSEPENYTGFGARIGPQVPSAMGAALSGVMPRASVVDQTPVSSDELANLYQQYLGRGVDASGAKSFTGLDRTSVINGIVNSPEYQSRGLLVPNVPITHNTLLSPSNKTGSDLADIRLHNLVG